MLDRISATIARYEMLPKGARIAVAVSGGPDSVCLLHALRELGVPVLAVAHYNHKLRGEASEEDQRFVERLARDCGVEFHSSSADSPPQGNLEQFARRARREFFGGLIQKGVADRVALGHTRDDQAETVLFRALRGSGLAGLAGILPVTSEGVIRPLLGISRAEVLAFLKERGLSYREDASNADPRFARNRIRHRLLPQLTREWNPRLAETLAHLADLAYEEERWWAGEIARRSTEVIVVSPGAIELHTHQIGEMPLAMARRLIRQAIRRVKGDLKGIEYDHIERILDLAGSEGGSGQIKLPGIGVVRSFNWLRLSANGASGTVPVVPVLVPGRYTAPDGNSLICLEVTCSQLDSSSCATLRLGGAEELKLRGWWPGDHYRPAGHSRDVKLKELFQRKKIPSWRRHSWPILCNGDKILWAKQFGPSWDASTGGGARVSIREIPLHG